ncbi:hypothetical protein LMG9673_04110 [Ralstonia pseudosolanacearum]|nr:hypothetical protein LMG9673_04110 [Ralstonia pseudosolanacearum]
MSRPLSLVHAPYPFPDESAASWIHRTCQLHGTTYKALAGYLGLKPTRDPDLAVPHDHVCHIGVGTSVSPKRLKALADIFHVVRENPQLKRLLNFDGNTPTYRFCPGCLSADPVPYLRIQWRFKAWQVCPKHRCRMVECCPTCGVKIQGAKPCTSVSGDEAPSILYCAACKQALVVANGESVREVWVSPAKLSVQHAIVSAVRNGGFRFSEIPETLSLDLMLWLIDNPDLVNDCLARSAPRPEQERFRFVMKELIDTYCVQNGSRRSLEDLLRHRKRWLKKKRSSRAEAAYEAFISRRTSC